MIQHKGKRFGIKPSVQRIQYGACNRYTKVSFNHWRCIGQHHGNRVTLDDAMALQCARQLAAALENFSPITAQIAVHHGQPMRIHLTGAFKE